MFQLSVPAMAPPASSSSAAMLPFGADTIYSSSASSSDVEEDEELMSVGSSTLSSAPSWVGEEDSFLLGLEAIGKKVRAVCRGLTSFQALGGGDVPQIRGKERSTATATTTPLPPKRGPDEDDSSAIEAMIFENMETPNQQQHADGGVAGGADAATDSPQNRQRPRYHPGSGSGPVLTDSVAWLRSQLLKREGEIALLKDEKLFYLENRHRVAVLQKAAKEAASEVERLSALKLSLEQENETLRRRRNSSQETSLHPQMQDLLEKERRGKEEAERMLNEERDLHAAVKVSLESENEKLRGQLHASPTAGPQLALLEKEIRAREEAERMLREAKDLHAAELLKLSLVSSSEREHFLGQQEVPQPRLQLQLENENASLKVQLLKVESLAEESLRAAKQQAFEAEEQNVSLRSQLGHAQREVSQISKVVQEMSEASARIEDRKRLSEEALQAEKLVSSGLRSELLIMRAKLNQLVEEETNHARHMQVEISELKKEALSAQSEAKGEGQLRLQLETRLADVSQQLASLQSDVEQSRRNERRLSSQLDHDVSATRAQLLQSQAEVDAARRASIGLEQELAASRSQLAAVQADQCLTDRTLSELRSELSGAREEADRALREERGRTAALRSEVDRALREERERMAAFRLEADRALQEERGRTAALRSELQSWQCRAEEGGGSSFNSFNFGSTLVSELGSLRSSVGSLQMQLATADPENARACARALESACQELGSAITSIVASGSEGGRAAANRDAVQVVDECVRLRELLRLAAAEASSYRAKLTEMQQNERGGSLLLQAARDEVLAARAEVERLRVALDASVAARTDAAAEGSSDELRWARAECARLQALLDSAAAKATSFGETLAELEGKALDDEKELRSALAGERAECTRLQALLDSAAAESSSFRETLAELERKALEKEGELRSALAGEGAECARLQALFDSAVAEAGLLREKVASLSQELAEARSHSSKLSRELEGIHSAIVAAPLVRSEREDSHDGASLLSPAERLHELVLVRDRAVQLCKTRSSELSRERRRNAQLDHALAIIRPELEHLKNAVDGPVAGLRQRLAQAVRRGSAMRSQAEEAKQEVATLTEAHAVAQARVAELEREAEVLRQQGRDRREEADELKISLKRVQREAEMTAEESAKMRHELIDVKAECARQQRSREKAGRHMESTVAALRKDHVETLAETERQSSARIADLEAALSSVQDEVTCLREALKEADARLLERDREVSSLQSQLTEAQASAQARSAALLTRAEKAEKDRVALRKHIRAAVDDGRRLAAALRNAEGKHQSAMQALHRQWKGQAAADAQRIGGLHSRVAELEQWVGSSAPATAGNSKENRSQSQLSGAESHSRIHHRAKVLQEAQSSIKQMLAAVPEHPARREPSPSRSCTSASTSSGWSGRSTEGVIVRTWRSGFRSALGEMDQAVVHSHGRMLQATAALGGGAR